MGKHKKDKRSKRHKKNKKRNYSSSSQEDDSSNKRHDSSSEEERIVRKKRKYSSTSDSDSSVSSESGFSQKTRKTKQSTCKYPDNVSSSSDEQKQAREEWMNLSGVIKTTSNCDRKRDRDHKKQLEREKQMYDPKTCDRELNPYWKHGGDGLPSFKKPVDSAEDDKEKQYKERDRYRKKESASSSFRKPVYSDDEDRNRKNYSCRYTKKESNWRKPRDSNESSNSKSAEVQIKQEKKSEVKSDYDRNSDSSSKTENQVFTEKELNILASKLVKAEIMGDTELVIELKEKLERARESVKKESSEEVILTRTDSQGHTQPLKLQSEYGETSDHKRKKKMETHKDGQRVRYFADDDKYSLKQMFENEKYNTVEDSNKEFSKMAGKIRKNDDMDDIFSDNIRKKVSDSKIDSKNRDRAIQEHQKVSRSLDNCNKCIQSESMKKHLMISMGETVYIALPAYEPLRDGHCLIVPIRHVSSATQLDENEWAEIIDVKKSLIKLFRTKNEDTVFYESAMYLHRFPHMSIECVPLPKEEGDMAPIYFKKAIDESETEWAQNKKLVSLRGRDVRRAIPKGLPYFSVTFGTDDGYAHVIEDEQLFPFNFAQEIIGGMLDLHHSKWKRPKNQNFEEQSKRVLEFSNDWKEYDCTSGGCL